MFEMHPPQSAQNLPRIKLAPSPSSSSSSSSSSASASACVLLLDLFGSAVDGEANTVVSARDGSAGSRQDMNQVPAIKRSDTHTQIECF
eukprot:COSAG06_NODE_9983_length_1774_cov_6.528358_2_plen_88_part_01